MIGIVRMTQKSGLKALVGAALLVLVVLLVWFFFLRPADLAKRAAEADAGAKISAGRTQSGAEAADVVVGNKDKEIEYDKATAEGNQGIRAAEGASDPVSTASSCATVRALCMQRSYQGSERCRTLLKSCSREPVATR